MTVKGDSEGAVREGICNPKSLVLLHFPVASAAASAYWTHTASQALSWGLGVQTRQAGPAFREPACMVEIDTKQIIHTLAVTVKQGVERVFLF